MVLIGDTISIEVCADDGKRSKRRVLFVVLGAVGVSVSPINTISAISYYIVLVFAAYWFFAVRVEGC